MPLRLLALPLVWLALLSTASAAEDRSFSVMAFNVENVFDVDDVSLYADFPVTGNAPDRWTPEQLARKLSAVVEVLRKVNDGKGPDVLVLNELEVDHTPVSTISVSDFITRHRGKDFRQLLRGELSAELRGAPVEAWLCKALDDSGLSGYRLILGDVTDPASESIRNAILTRLPVHSIKQHKLEGARTIIEAALDIEGERVFVFANHWKSGAGNATAERVRIGNARVLRARVDELLRENAEAAIIVAGDLNSHYDQSTRYPYLTETGIEDVLGSQGDALKLRTAGGAALYNLWYELPPALRRSDAFRGEWGTLMHLIISRGLADGRGVDYQANSFRTVEIAGLNAYPVTGLPWDLSRLGPGAGVSDHFPVIASFRIAPAGEKPGVNPLRTPAITGPAAPRWYAHIDPAQLRSATVVAQLDPKGLAEGMGELLRVEGKWEGKMRVRIGDVTYPVWSHDENVMAALRATPEGDPVRWIAQLGFHKGQVQLVIESAIWMRQRTK